jgi:ABC-type branched-subunit amino acid transport system ATPase component/branched-subunit amino acid ABC-type transport system permease component
MSTVIQFALLGLGVSAAYTLLAQGMVLIYRGSGVLNFAHGAFALLGAFVYFELHQQQGWPTIPALLISVGVVAGFGALVFHLIMRRLRDASTVTSAVATLGLLILIQGVVVVIWGGNPQSVTQILPTDVVRVGGVAVGVDKLLLFLIAGLLTVALWAATRFTPIGLALRATAENPLAASSLGWSATMMGTLTWTIGSALAAVAGILIAPLTSIDTTAMPLLVIPVLAAALLGSLSSFPLTFLAATAIGIGQSEMTQYVDVQGLSTALPFVVIIAFLVIRGRGLPARAFVVTRLPELGTGRIRLGLVIPVVAVMAWLIWVFFPIPFLDALTVTLAWAMILLSVVVLLGYAGQLSLAQFALGGVAAFAAVHLIDGAGLSFPVAALLAVLITLPVGVLLALPALRTRGIDLAVVTLGVAVSLSAIVFASSSLTGGALGMPTGPRTIFGWDFNAIQYPERYALVVFVLFVLCAIVAANLRRGIAGRRLIAVRTNERAAAALGISVFAAKLYAFAVAAVFAATGGIMLAFKDQMLTLSSIEPLQSILAVAYAVVGGVGFVIGPIFGSLLVAGSIGSWILESIFHNPDPAWLSIIGGVSVLVLVVFNQNGMVSAHIDQALWVGRKLRGLVRRGVIKPDAAPTEVAVSGTRSKVPEATLDVRNLTVRFGAVTAVKDASLTVSAGEVVGLIGPNGAGKTTAIDAITGFVPAADGTIGLDGENVSRWAAHRRARAGISRSFQSLELFESSTVRENITIGADRAGPEIYLSSLVRPRTPQLTPVAAAAVEELGLTEHLDVQVKELPYGMRRLVAIARAIAAGPSILLLDEPAAGLSGGEVTELVTVVRRLAREWGMGILLVEHDMGFVMEVCDRITVLNFGNQIATGTPTEVSHDPAVVAAYLGEAEDDGPKRPAPAPSATVPSTSGNA